MEDISKDKDILRKLFKECDEYPFKERYHALYIRSLGYDRRLVAELFCRDEDTIKGWEDRWLRDRTVRDKERSGRPPGMDMKLERTIAKLVDENNPSRHGMNCSFWDCNELSRFLLMHGILLSDESIRRVLKKHGFRYVKADYRYAQADEREKALFLRDIDQMVGDREDGSSILFMDEMGTLLHPKKGYVWTRKEKAVVKTYSSHKKVSVFGAVNPLTGSSELMMTSGKTGEGKFISFLERVYGRFRGTIHLLLDGFRTHRSARVGEWLQSHPRMRLMFLPKYSPDMNVVEWLWGFSRKKFLNSRVFGGTKHLMSSLSWFFRRLPKHTIRRVCNIDILLNRIT